VTGGEVVGTGPLAGRQVLVTRPAHQSTGLCERIEALGGRAIIAPTIATGPGDAAAMADAVRGLADGRFAGLCLTSANGVRSLAEACARAGVEAGRALDGLRLVGAVGPRTADLVASHLGVEATVVPDTATGLALGRAVPAGSGAVLLPRGDLAGGDLVDGLAAAGWTPVPVVAYRTVTAPALDPAVVAALAAGEVDLLTFTSASTVRGFVELLGGRSWSGRVVTIGPVTSAACCRVGMSVGAEADPHDLEGLVGALVRAAGR
jgi:uroporphyrinogen-III synthase